MTNDRDDIKSLIQLAGNLLERARYLLERESSGFPEELRELVQQRICLGCRKKIPGSVRVVRGNHESCYRRVHRKIQAGILSDTEAIDAGLLTPPSPGGKSRQSTSLDRYIAVRDENVEYRTQDSP